MVKSITNFINGDVYIKSQTSSSVYLSDGTHWNKKNFHQTRSLVSAFIRREIDLESSMQELRKATIEKYAEAEIVLEEYKRKLKEIAPNKELFYLSDILMPFGKYRDKKLSYIASNDISYYNWLFDSTLFEPFTLKSKPRVVTPPIKPLSNSNDDSLPF